MKTKAFTLIIGCLPLLLIVPTANQYASPDTTNRLSYAIVTKAGTIKFASGETRRFVTISGLAPIKTGGKWGFLDKTGKVTITPQFDDASSFSDGLASVKAGKKWGFIVKDGASVISPQFDKVADFFKGLAHVTVGDKSGYIDKTGNYIWPLGK